MNRKDGYIVDNQVYSSASSALEAYIEHFEGKKSPVRYTRNLEDLFLPKSPLHLTARRSLETGIRDTPQERKLYEAKRLITESYRQLMAQEQHKRQVKNALETSDHLLARLSESITSTDTLSMSTDLLLAAEPMGTKNKLSKHVYGYKKPAINKRPLNSEKIIRPRTGISGGRNHSSEGQSLLNTPTQHDRPPLQLHDLNSYSLPTKYVTHKASSRILSTKSITKKLPVKSCNTGRAPPSWITDVEDQLIEINDSQMLRNRDHSTKTNTHTSPSALIGRTTPSWVGNLTSPTSDVMSMAKVPKGLSDATHESNLSKFKASGGRVTPSWIGEGVSPSNTLTLTAGTGINQTSKPVQSCQRPRSERGNRVKDTGRNSPSWIDGLASPDTPNTLNGGRNPPSWIESNVSPMYIGQSRPSDMGLRESEPINCNRLPPSWIEDGLSELTSSIVLSSFRGRPAPSWITDVRSGISSSAGHAVPSWIDGVGASEMASFPGRPRGTLSNHNPSYSQPTAGEITSEIETLEVDELAKGDGMKWFDSPDTEVVLSGDRSWEKLPEASTIKPPKQVRTTELHFRGKTENSLVDAFLTDCMNNKSEEDSPRISGRDQPGPMEALKNMLFTMQSVSTAGKTPRELDSSLPQQTGTDETGDEPMSATSVSEEFYAQPGGQSLERAMLHLSRLKSLVQSSDASQSVTTETEAGSSTMEADPN